MKEFINSYKQKSLIAEEEIGFDQITKHLASSKKDLRVAKANLKIDTEASYNYAYLAMLRTSRALMFSCGLRPIDGKQHKTIVSFSEYILGNKYSGLVRHFDRMRKKRNRFTYDELGLIVSETETQKALEDAIRFVEEVSKFIQNKSPQKRLL